MKCLSIVRPSGGRIASGEKTLQVRRWHPDLNPSEDLLIVENERFLQNDGDEDDDGIAIAIVRVKAVRPLILADMRAACASYFEEGWLAWELSDVRPVTHSFENPCGTGYLRGRFPTPRQTLNIQQDVLGRRLP